ncbi:MAG: glycosyltransferase family 2 protein [Candidatus Komeilibacteria bacterium]|nr:glycosyltransferase family 2 protein [Candidatus Komeilibacteria bacterium]
MAKTVVVLPAYNAAKTLEKTVRDIPREYVDEIILVDDYSRDDTLAVAEKMGLTVVRHYDNRGYGGNQKSCYTVALEHGADIVVMLHPDYQYDPKLIKFFVEFIRDGYFDVMLGSRIRSRREALDGGMPKYKYYFNRLLSLLENMVTGQNLSEWHTGMRAYKREVLERVDYRQLSDDFVFDSQMLFAIVKAGYRMGDIPVPVRYFADASSINFRRSLRYGLSTVWEAVKFIFKK